jgi:hypothetical protein
LFYLSICLLENHSKGNGRINIIIKIIMEKKMRKAPKEIFRVCIDTQGDRGRRLDILATAWKMSRCELVAYLIDDAYARTLNTNHKGLNRQ